MSEVTNLDHKRVCDVSADARVIEIRRKDCVTRNHRKSGRYVAYHARVHCPSNVTSNPR